MESKKLTSGLIGAEGSYDVSIIEGNVVATIAYDGVDLKGTASITIKTKAGLEKLKQLIPGKIDDMIIDLIASYLGL